MSILKYESAKEISVEKRMMDLADVENLKDLEEIKNRFPKITIGNYVYLKEWLLEEEKEAIKEEENIEKKKLLTFLGESVDIETLRKLAKSFGKND